MVCLLLGAIALSAATARADRIEPAPRELKAVGVDEHLGITLPLDLPFVRHDGQAVRLGDLFGHGRPVILSLNYSNCPMLCSLQLNGLIDALQALELTAGRDYDVLSVSIDPLETPQRARLTQQRYVQAYGRAGTGNGWQFLVGRDTSIRDLADAVGFRYQYVPARREYAHAAVFMICTADGRVSRYLYGVNFPPQTVKMSLVEAGEGTIGTSLDQVLLFCFHYDAASGRYSIAARKLMKVGGLVTLLVLSVVLGRYWRQERRRGDRTPCDKPAPQQPPALVESGG